MKRFLLVILALASAFSAYSQPAQAFKGWPGHDDISDLKSCFADPPKGYGNVPFYWWTGDSLDLDRLRDQLDILSESALDGLCVSYNHTSHKVDIELNAGGFGGYGRLSGGEPRAMSEEWFDIWNKFSADCASKGVGLGMDDYVIAWPGNGEFMDSVVLSPSIAAYQGRLVKVEVPKGEARPSNALSLIEEGPEKTVYVCTEASPWLHPQIGKVYVDKYFRKFEDHMDAAGKKGMNYFFQDELQYDLRITSWCEDMPQQFLARKGYDIIPLLGCLFIEDKDKVDAAAAKVRLDYAEVLTQLSEERFFKPVFDWNAEKGLIYGCDNEGRGLNPTQYLDYFRAVSWFTAPGNDAPSRGSSFRQTKVSSSIAHLYGRPRTWLEAFHSIGWDANGALLKTQLDHHLIAGGNLLCMHGLYYSTHGGWWEWAPPCFHFRMPYWDHMKLWLEYAERMCFLLSQGQHVCDIAILYPTETMQAFPGTDPGQAFAVSDELSAHGLDYDFIDWSSLQNAGIEGSSLTVAGESYRILVLAGIRAMHEETLAKVQAFKNAGGKVFVLGEAMPELNDDGFIVLDSPAGAVGGVRSLIKADFSPESGEGRVLHRHVGDRDVYMVMNVKKGERLHFRAFGNAECWDAMDGTVRPLSVVDCDADGSTVIFDGEDGESMLVVFSQDESASVASSTAAYQPGSMQHLDGDWNITVKPTMNNKWGDFRLPASDEYIGVEARQMTCTPLSGGSVSGSVTDVQGYGPYMMTCTLSPETDLDAFLKDGMNDARWSPYSWSWQYGVLDSPGSQGWHGLKSKVEPRFLILDQGGHQVFRTNVLVRENGKYRIVVEGTEPSRLLLDGSAPKKDVVRLKRGWHSLVIAYSDTKKVEYKLENLRGDTVDSRDRSMVVLYPAGSEVPSDRGMYDRIVASRWYGTDHLVYDVNPSPTDWRMEFETAPGTAELRFAANGTVREVIVDGVSLAFKEQGGEVCVNVPDPSPSFGNAVVIGTPEAGCPGAAFFDSPVRIRTSGGRIPEGDWTAFGALGFYSGGILYEKDVNVWNSDGRVFLDLGEVDATCEVSVNGTLVRKLISKPYRVEVTDLVKPGANHFSVLVYSTLSNHYRTTPSPYRGTPHAGLIGPVRMEYE